MAALDRVFAPPKADAISAISSLVNPFAASLARISWIVIQNGSHSVDGTAA
jgi:hypothetical protein